MFLILEEFFFCKTTSCFVSSTAPLSQPVNFLFSHFHHSCFYSFSWFVNVFLVVFCFLPQLFPPLDTHRCGFRPERVDVFSFFLFFVAQRSVMCRFPVQQHFHLCVPPASSPTSSTVVRVYVEGPVKFADCPV